MDKILKIGDWVCYCCKEDLFQVTTQEQLIELTEDSELFSHLQIFETKEEALEKLSDD